MKRYLVTGAAGFIASAVSRMLLEQDHQVVGIDNLNDAYDARLKRWRLGQLESHPNFHFRRLDIADRRAMRECFAADAESAAEADIESRPYSAVINLAARAGVRASVENPWVYYQTNCEGTLCLLDLCREFGVHKFVLASTSSLYGADTPVPYREDADTSRPLSPYAASKKAAETLCYTYHHLHGLDVTAFRYFTVYGPAGRPDMAIFRFIRRIAEGESIVVFGDGLQQRDFTYVDDVASGTIAALGLTGYQTINLGNDRPVRLTDVIDGIAKLLGRRPVIEYRASHPADVPTTWASIEKAGELLHWKPKVEIEEGLRRCVTWYRENREMVLPLELADR